MGARHFEADVPGTLDRRVTHRHDSVTRWALGGTRQTCPTRWIGGSPISLVCVVWHFSSFANICPIKDTAHKTLFRQRLVQLTEVFASVSGNEKTTRTHLQGSRTNGPCKSFQQLNPVDGGNCARALNNPSLSVEGSLM